MPHKLLRLLCAFIWCENLVSFKGFGKLSQGLKIRWTNYIMNNDVLNRFEYQQHVLFTMKIEVLGPHYDK